MLTAKCTEVTSENKELRLNLETDSLRHAREVKQLQEIVHSKDKLIEQLGERREDQTRNAVIQEEKLEEIA